MTKGVSGKRHAQAVFQLALENGGLEKWSEELLTLEQVLSDREVISLLENPKLHFSAKQELLRKVLPDLSDLAMNLASFLIHKNRLRIMPDLRAEFERLSDAYHGREAAEIVTAVPISAHQAKHVAESLGRIAGKQVVIHPTVDPSIMGGIVARVGDRLLDGSIRTRLQDLRKTLA